jgi:hypothetical protein
MDPYLEDYLWPDVQQALANQFRRQLAPLVEPTYAVRLAVAVVNDRVPAHELGILTPNDEPEMPEWMQREQRSAMPITPAPLSIPLTVPTQVRVVSVEIRATEKNLPVTVIEILAPSNKREPGLSSHIARRDELLMAHVHVVEIDLLRRGARAWLEEPLAGAAYLAALIRAGSIRAEVWPIELRQRLPVLPIPLRRPQPDVPLDLQLALDTVYDEARYALSLRYDGPPPPPAVSPADVAWVAERVRAWRPHS